MEIEIIAAVFYWYLKQQAKIDNGKKGGWQGYRTTTEKWHEKWIWYTGDFKEFRVQVEIFVSVLIDFPNNS